MSNLNGWNLSARLVFKHFGALGDTFAEAIAGFDPETATAADRDNLQLKLLSISRKVAEARNLAAKEQDDVDNLTKSISSDSNIAETLLARLAKGEVSEATVALFCDELEANKAKLPTEQAEANDAKAFLIELTKILDGVSEQIASFDKRATAAKGIISKAKAAQDLQTLRMERQAELSDLSFLSESSTALSALTKKASKMNADAEGLKIVADINQAPLDRAAELTALRKSATAVPSESVSDRLKRLSTS